MTHPTNHQPEIQNVEIKPPSVSAHRRCLKFLQSCNPFSSSTRFSVLLAHPITAPGKDGRVIVEIRKVWYVTDPEGERDRTPIYKKSLGQFSAYIDEIDEHTIPVHFVSAASDTWEVMYLDEERQ